MYGMEKGDMPYYMYSILKLSTLRPVPNEVLNNLQFLFATALKATRIVKHVSLVVDECQLIGDVVLATLHTSNSEQAR